MKIKKILILGASSDIGIEASSLFLKKNWQVIAHFNSNKKKLQQLKNNYKNLEFVKFDFKNKKNLNIKLKKVFNHGYHSIINLVGFIDNKSYEKSNLQDTINSISINALIPNLIIKNNIRYMKKEKWGRIVNGSSLGVPYGGGEFSFNYNLSKHCLEFIPGKFKSWAKSNILINNLRIGHTDTKIHKKMKKALFGKKRIKLIPLKRMATPKEMAEYLYFLGSEKNSYMTNETLSSTGGE